MRFVADKHHELGIEHLINNARAALFMGLGLGKTGTTLTAFDILHGLGEAKAMLVVAPLRVANLTWPNEIAKWDHTRWMRVANLRTKAGWQRLEAGSADVYLINYEMLPRFVEDYLKLKRGPLPFDTVVFDELTMAKNYASKRINALRPHLSRVKRRWGLTGTPTPNSMLELFAQIRLLDDGERLGRAFHTYRSCYFHATDYMEYHWVINEGAQAKIEARISDLCLVLRSADYLDVPEPVFEDVNVPLPAEVVKQYRTLEKELLLSMGGDEVPVVAVNAAALVGKLTQITGGSVYNEERETVELHSAKLDKLVELCAGLRKRKEPTLIACQYLHEQRRILKAIPDAALFVEDDLDAWNAKKIPFMVANPQSIGHGLNLQGGSRTIIWFSLPWSRELYDQFIARLVRRGQDSAVTVHRLLCPDTIDDVVVESLRERGDNQKSLLSALVALRRMRSP